MEGRAVTAAESRTGQQTPRRAQSLWRSRGRRARERGIWHRRFTGTFDRSHQREGSVGWWRRERDLDAALRGKGSARTVRRHRRNGDHVWARHASRARGSRCANRERVHSNPSLSLFSSRHHHRSPRAPRLGRHDTDATQRARIRKIPPEHAAKPPLADIDDRSPPCIDLATTSSRPLFQIPVSSRRRVCHNNLLCILTLSISRS